MTIRDEVALRTVPRCEEGETSVAALRDASLRYPDLDRYSAAVLYGRDRPSVALSSPRYADAEPEALTH